LKVSSPLGFSPICATWFVLFYLFGVILLGWEYKLWSHSLWHFLLPRVSPLRSKCSPQPSVLKYR
jgi:hypothetical protein